jgi:hypothetical protein
MLYFIKLLKMSPRLQSLDVGWCRLLSASHCLQEVASHCPQLRRLYLTAVRFVFLLLSYPPLFLTAYIRGIRANDLLLLADSCPLLEQLDILGSHVMFDEVRQLLERAKALQLLDVSFAGISWANVENLQSLFPNVAIKRSFS